MRHVFAMYPFASATRYGPVFAGNWNSLVLLAHGAKHCGSELGSVTTFGGAALASPAATNRVIAAATRVRCGIEATFEWKRRVCRCSKRRRATGVVNEPEV